MKSHAAFIITTVVLSSCISVPPILGMSQTTSIRSIGTVVYQASGFLRLSSGRFQKGGYPFMIHANNYDNALGVYLIGRSRATYIDQALQECLTYGLNSVRTWATGTSGEGNGVYSLWRSNPQEFFKRFDEFIQLCKDKNIFLVITLGVAEFFTRGGGNLGDGASGSYAIYRDWVTQICGRYKNEPQILLWEVLNEYEYSGQPAGLVRNLNERASNDIRSVDPNHLISTGSGNCGYDDAFWDSSNGAAGIDIASIHIYSDEVENMLSWKTGWPSYELVRGFLRNWEERASGLGKAILFGELGGDVGYDYANNRTTKPDDQILRWCLQVIYELDASYGFHAFRSGSCTDKYSIVPGHNPQIIEELLLHRSM